MKAIVTHYQKSKDVTIQVLPEQRTRIFCMITRGHELSNELINLISTGTRIEIITKQSRLDWSELNLKQ